MEGLRDKLEIIEEELDNALMEIPFSIIGSPREIEEVLEKNKLSLHPNLMGFYSEFSKIKFSWNTPDDLTETSLKCFQNNDKIIRGKFEFRPIEEVINGLNGDGWKNITWFDSMSDEEKQFRQSLYPFDIGLSEEYIVLKCINGFIDDKLYLLSIYEDELIDLEMNIERYFELLLQTKGFEFWLHGYRFPESEARERLMHYIPQLFPDSQFPLKGFEN